MLGLLAGNVHGQTANFSSESQVVVLHVAVRGGKGYVSGLEQKAFRVVENKQPQAVSFFSSQDTPVTVGLVIDSTIPYGKWDFVETASTGWSKLRVNLGFAPLAVWIKDRDEAWCP